MKQIMIVVAAFLSLGLLTTEASAQCANSGGVVVSSGSFYGGGFSRGNSLFYTNRGVSPVYSSYYRGSPALRYYGTPTYNYYPRNAGSFYRGGYNSYYGPGRGFGPSAGFGYPYGRSGVSIGIRF